MLRHTHGLQKALKLVVEIEAGLGGGDVAEHHLNCLCVLRLLINLHNLFGTTINLGIRIQTIDHIDQAHIQGCFPAVGGDLQEVVHMRVNPLLPHIISAAGNILQKHLEIIAAWLGRVDVSVKFRQTHHLIHVVKVCDRGEDRCQLRYITKLTETSSQVVAVGIHIDLKFCGLFAEHGYPGIEIMNIQKFQFAILQEFLHYENIGNGIGDRCSGGHNHSATIVLPLDTVNLVHHSIAFPGAGIAQTTHPGDAGMQAYILIVMCFVHKQGIDTQIIKGHITHIVRHIVLHFFQHIHYRHALGIDLLAVGEITYCFIQPLQLLLIQIFIVFLGKGQHVKTTVGHQDGIKILIHDLTQGIVPLLDAEIPAIHHQKLGFGVHLVKHLHPLGHDVIGDHIEILLGFAQPPQLHTGCDHGKGLAGTHVVGKEGIGGKQDPGNGVLLVRMKLNFRIHVREVQEAAIKDTAANVAILAAVCTLQSAFSVRIAPNPVLEFGNHFILLFKYLNRLCLVKNPGLSVRIHHIENSQSFHVQNIFQQPQHIHALGTVDLIACMLELSVLMTLAESGLLGNFPKTRGFIVPHPILF